VLASAEPNGDAGAATDDIEHVTRPVSRSRLLEAITAALTDRLGARDGRSPAAAPDGTHAPLRGAGRRILVAEDHAANAMYTERLLTRAGHAVARARDGRHALDLYEAAPYDLILMDCQMPELDGYAVTREIRRREHDAGRPRTTIVAMTAGTLGDAREECLAAGMDDYLSKPFDEPDLVRVLARWLPATADDGETVLDAARVAELRTVFHGAELDAMWRALAAAVTADLERIDAAIAANRPAGVAAAAHSIRASAQMVGAAELIDAATAVERAAQARTSDSGALDALREWCSALLDAVRAQIADPEHEHQHV